MPSAPVRVRPLVLRLQTAPRLPRSLLALPLALGVANVACRSPRRGKSLQPLKTEPLASHARDSTGEIVKDTATNFNLGPRAEPLVGARS